MPRLVVLSVAVVLMGCAGEPSSSAPPLTMLSAPLTRGVSPAVTTAGDGTIHHAWVTLDSAERGHLFTMAEGRVAVEIVDPLGPAQFDPETPPKLQVAPDGALMLSYAVSVPDSTAKYQARSGLRFTRSTDNGVSWSAPVTVADDGDLGTYRNDHTMHIALDGKVYLAWLDERTGTTLVYSARSDDQGRTWSRNVAVDTEGSCECCRTPITTGPDGAVYTVWRKKLPGGLRDMVVARSTDLGVTWSAPVRVHADSFAIDFCPDAGPSIAVDANNRLHVAWWTGKAGAAGVKHVFSDDGGQTFSAPSRLGVAEAAKASHAQLLLVGDRQVAVTWEDGRLQPARVALALSGDRGASFDPVTYLSEPAAAASFPVLTAAAGKLHIVWQERGAVEGAGPPAPAEAEGPWAPYDGRTAVRLVRAQVALP